MFPKNKLFFMLCRGVMFSDGRLLRILPLLRYPFQTQHDTSWRLCLIPRRKPSPRMMNPDLLAALTAEPGDHGILLRVSARRVSTRQKAESALERYSGVAFRAPTPLLSFEP